MLCLNTHMSNVIKCRDDTLWHDATHTTCSIPNLRGRFLDVGIIVICSLCLVWILGYATAQRLVVDICNSLQPVATQTLNCICGMGDRCTRRLTIHRAVRMPLDYTLDNRWEVDRGEGRKLGPFLVTVPSILHPTIQIMRYTDACMSVIYVQ